jgi:gliding motility-associated-like protein
MKLILRAFFLGLFCWTCLNQTYATHNRAGEITYEQIGELTIRATITTYTKTSSTSADRDSLELFWGDGNSEFVIRANGEGNPLPNDIKVNYYIAEHTYPGRGTFTISMMDPNRIAGILNINYPNSVNVPFYIETTFTFLSTQFQGFNNSAILLQPPLDFGCVGQRFVHNPNAFDIDGDSLSFELIIPLQDKQSVVPEYSFPNEIMPGGENNISLNPVTGNFVWDAPQVAGEYNIAIRILEWREGVLINSLIRDMQILVEDNCNNEPPAIITEDEICVIAGETIRFDVNVSDPDDGQKVSLSASGGPFQAMPNPATLDVEEGFINPPFSGTFIWETTCDHISDQYYQLVFRAVDNATGDSTGLADLKTVRIKIVGPPPENVQAEAMGSDIMVNWDLPYDCEITQNDYFLGFSVWRKIGSNQFPIDSCVGGLEGTGYEKIIFLTKDNDGMKYGITDSNLEKGKTYCYRVLAEFARTTISGNPFNRVQSLPSNEFCLQISRDLPLITKVSIEETDIINGSIKIEWTKPLADDLDTIKNPGPYRYQLLRSQGFGNMVFEPVSGADFTIQNFKDPIDTSFTDMGLNTQNSAYNYLVAFYVAGNSNQYGESPLASSLFLDIVSTDETNIISWEADVPWNNTSYVIYRLNNITSVFDSISTTIESEFEDINLVNGAEICYRVKAYGSYGISNLIDPLINFSQIKCGIPIDTVPPCAPKLTVFNGCEDFNISIPSDDFLNTLEWTRPNLECDDVNDVAGYNIYYAENFGANFEFVANINEESTTSFDHNPDFGIAGCYAVTAIDSLGNESMLSDSICVDNCPLYELPNVFTPNGDGANDLFKPIYSRFIDHVEMEIFNRWGQLVYKTENPEILWNGQNQSGRELAEGVYFYSCKVYESRLAGSMISDKVLTGYIHIIRNAR